MVQIDDLNLIESIDINSGDTLLVIDMQNDFLPGGALEVANGDEIISGINKVTLKFHELDRFIIFTQDWHPHDHHSFASAHPTKKPGDLFEKSGIGPVLWPDHCVQGSFGADFASDINTDYATMILRKGFHKTIDSYSAFLENDKITETGLKSFLKSFNIKRIFLCGLALDYCVYYSAIDAKVFGNFEVVILVDLTKPVNYPNDSVSNALKDMIEHKIIFISSDSII